MHFSGLLVLGVLIVIPWLVAMLRQLSAGTGNVDPLDSRSILFWLFLLGIIVLAIGIGTSFTGRH